MRLWVQAIPRTKGAFTPKMSSPQMDIFSALATDMDPRGRHLFINAIANQLRYPNVHTHFFSCVLLYLFLDAPKVGLASRAQSARPPCQWVGVLCCVASCLHPEPGFV